MSKPKVYINEYNGRFGNHLFQFAWALSMSKQLDYDLQVPGVATGSKATTGSPFPKTHGFLGPEITDYVYLGPTRIIQHPWHVNDCTNIELFKQMHYGKNLRGDNYFQNYQNFKPIKNIVREYLELPKDPRGAGKVGIHFRGTDWDTSYQVPLKYYFDCIEKCSLKEMLLITDDPNHNAVQSIKNRYNNIEIVSNTNTDINDFRLLKSCDEIISSTSTFSFWAGFLSEAKKIFHPSLSNVKFSQNMFVDDEDRYIKVEL